MRIVVEWFGQLRDDVRCVREEIEAPGSSLLEIYEALESSRHLSLPASLLRVALDGEIVDWDRRPADGSQVVFLPPVGGG